MDINFFSGDNYFSGSTTGVWWDLFKVILGPALGFFGAYVISLAAFKRDKVKTADKEKRDRASYAALFCARIRDLDQHARTQIKHLQRVAAELEVPGDEDFNFVLLAGFNYSRIAEMDDDRLFRAMILDSRMDTADHRKAYLSLTAQIDFLTRIVPHLQIVFERLREDHLLHQQDWKKGFNATMQLVNSWKGAHLRDKGMDTSDTFLTRLVILSGRAFIDQEGKADSNMSAISARFIEPLMKLLNEFHTDPRCHELAPHLNMCGFALLNLESAKSSARSLFLEYATKIEDALGSIESAMTTLRR